jgi:NAD-dependent SIR2 family protein deacetylase
MIRVLGSDEVVESVGVWRTSCEHCNLDFEFDDRDIGLGQYVQCPRCEGKTGKREWYSHGHKERR